MSVNYGAIGSTIAHELGHSFGPYSGINFNENGQELYLFTNKTMWDFEERLECFLDEYNEQWMNRLGMFVDGEKTLDENVADDSMFLILK